jgi:hypothetical protein
VHRVEARLAARSGNRTRAEKLARRAVRTAEQCDDLRSRADTVAALAEVLQLAGRTDEAAAAGAEAVELYDRKGAVAARERARTVVGTPPFA